MAEGSTIIKEIRARFTADLSGYRKAMQDALRPTQELQKQIDQMQTRLRGASASAGAEGQKMSRALTAAGRAAEQLGKRAQALTGKQIQLSRAIKDQQAKLSTLQSDYGALQDRAAGLQSVFNQVKTATAGLDLSTPLQEQVEQVKHELGQYDTAIETLRRRLSNASSGSLIELPEGGFASISEAEGKLNELLAQFDATDARLEQLQAAMQAVGAENLDYASTAGLKQLQTEIDQTKQKMVQMKLQAERTASGLLSLVEGADRVGQDLGHNAQKTDELKQSVEELDASESVFTRMKSAVTGLGSKFGGVVSAARKVGSVTLGVGTSLGKVALRASGLSAVGTKLRAIGIGAKSSTGGVNGLLRSIKRIGVVSLGLNVAKGLFGRLRSVISSYVSTQEGLSASVDRLKNGLGQALAPAVNIVINAMSRLMPYIIGVADAIGTLLTNLFGKGWTTVATGAAAAASATGSAASAQEKYNRTLAGFDEITKLDDNSGSGGSGGGSGGGAGSQTTPIEGKLPAWLTDLTGQIRERLAAEDFTGIGTLLADKLGIAVDGARDQLNNSAFRGKVSKLCGHVVDTINGFFGQLTAGDALDTISARIGALIGDGITLALDTVDQFLTGIRWENIGLSVAQGINGALASLSADKVNFGTILADLLQRKIDTAKGFIDGLDWSKLGGYVAANINSAFNGFDWRKAGETLSGGIRNILVAITSALANIQWDEIAHRVTDFVSGIDWGGMTSALFEGIGTALAGVGLFIGTLILDAFSGIGEFFFSEIEAVGGNVALGILNGILDGFIGIGDWIKEHIVDPFINGFMKVCGIHSPAKNPKIVSLGTNLVAGIFNGIIDWMGGITSWVRQYILQPVQNAVHRLGSIVLEIENKFKNTASVLWERLKSAWGSAQNHVVEVWNKLKNTAGNLWGGFQSAWGNARNRVVEVWNQLKNSAGSLWNGFSSGWGSRSIGINNYLTNSGNSLFGSLANQWGTRYLGVQASVQSKISPKNLFTNEQVSFAFKNGTKKVGNLIMTRMAKGGVINAATLFGGGVLAGEAGKEAIVPLDRNIGWADNVAKRMNELAEQRSERRPEKTDIAPITIHNYVQLDGRTVWQNVTRYAQSDAKQGLYPLSGCV